MKKIFMLMPFKERFLRQSPLSLFLENTENIDRKGVKPLLLNHFNYL